MKRKEIVITLAGWLAIVAFIGSVIAQQATPPLPTKNGGDAPSATHGRGLHLPPDLGAKIQAVNARHGVPELRAKIATAAPIQPVYTYAYLAPIKNQGQYGDCWAFASIGVLECLNLAQAKVISASEQFIIDNNTDGYGCNGGDVAFDFLQTIGTSTAADCPYLGCASRDSAKVAYKLAQWGYVSSNASTPDTLTLKSALLAHGPLSVGVAAGGNWDSYAGGNAVLKGGYVVNHEVVVCGWNDTLQAWYVRNSWGTSWGNQGFCWVGYGQCQVGTGAAFASLAAPSPDPSPTPPTPNPTPVPPTPGALTANLVITASANPSIVGQAVTFTATATPSAGSVQPTGQVLWNIDNAPTVQIMNLANGQATLPLTFSTSGLHGVVAKYLGDSVYPFGKPVVLDQMVSAIPPPPGPIPANLDLTKCWILDTSTNQFYAPAGWTLGASKSK